MRITVLGAGNSGLAMSAHLSYHGNTVSLWNRSNRTIGKLIETKTIYVEGVINGPVKLFNVTTDIKEALEGSELILVTTPASSHSDLGTLLGVHMNRAIPVVLNPGRTFGSINFYKSFKKTGNCLELKIAETQTILYTCRKNSFNSVTIYSLKNVVEIACLESGKTREVIANLPDCIIHYYKDAGSVLRTSLGNVGPVLHCIPLMLNTGWTESKASEYKYYYDGITPTIGKFIENIDNERLAIAQSFGLQIESTSEWMKKEYATAGEDLYECIQNNSSYNEIYAPKSIHHRYIYEDVPYGLVPLEKIGQELGVNTKHITLAIDLANALTNDDFRKHMSWVSKEIIESYL